MLVNTEKEKLEKMDDITLVEELLRRQSEVLDLYIKREACRNNMEMWSYCHDLYYNKMSDLIEVKYMVVGRMHK